MAVVGYDTFPFKFSDPEARTVTKTVYDITRQANCGNQMRLVVLRFVVVAFFFVVVIFFVVVVVVCTGL